MRIPPLVGALILVLFVETVVFLNLQEKHAPEFDQGAEIRQKDEEIRKLRKALQDLSRNSAPATPRSAELEAPAPAAVSQSRSLDSSPQVHEESDPSTAAGPPLPPKRPYQIVATKQQQILQAKVFSDYRALWHRMFSEDFPKEQRRFVMIDGNGSGFGNHVHGAVSALLLGLVSGRVVLGLGSVGEIYEPARDLDWRRSPPADADLKSKTFLQVGGYANMGGGGPGSEFYELLACGNLVNNTVFGDAQVLHITSNQYFGTLIINNPNYREFFKNTFGRDVFGPVFRYFFKPRAELSERLAQLKKTLFKDHYVIGIHLRQEYIRTRPAPLARDVMVKCAEMASPTPGAKIFLATDSGTDASAIVEQYGDRVIRGDGSREMDMLLLQECDDLVVTVGSTFSDVAYGANSMLPLKATEVLQCVRDVTVQPCYFFYKQGIGKATCFPKEFYAPDLYDNPIFLNHRNCYSNFQHGADHM